MDYIEKYSETLDLDELSVAQQVAVDALMREGELRYRDYLVSVLEKTKEVMISNGEEINLPINALINIVKLEPTNAK